MEYKGIIGIVKRGEVVDVFRKEIYELFTLTKPKLKGNGDVLWCGINGIIADIEEIERARKCVVILTNDVCHSAVINFRCVNTRNLWVKFKFSKVEICLMVRMISMRGMSKKERGSGTTWTLL